jgi:hypothetical protein
MIWLYGIDQHHSLASYHEDTRLNILPMAYAWAADFPEELCDSAAASMARNYIDAWIFFVANQTGVRSWFWQEAFIECWRSNEYDLMLFTDAERKLIRKLIKQVRDRSFPPNILETLGDKIDDVVRMRREGQITEAVWKEYGTKLVIAWVLSMTDMGDKLKTKADAESTTLEATDTVTAKATAEATAASVNGNVLRQVPWDGPLLKGLLEPVDPTAREPWKLINDKTIARPHGKPWMSVDRYIQLLRNASFQANMDELAGSLAQMGVGGSAAEGSEDVTMEG